MQTTDNQTIQAQAAAAQLNKPQLLFGSKGEAVKEMQKLLIHWGYCINADGHFGHKTLEAVKAYQRRVFLKADGIVGNITWQALYTGAPINMPVLRKGSKGQAVMTLQQALKDAGNYKSTIDGDFGPGTDGGLRAFQKNANLAVDGITGSSTWYALSRIYAPYHC
ncbi:peptidoglycan-binding domain-containing protein [Microcoleus sp. FACHB-672]|uniref:peptidoglycan-binding domain-containing protein n=1 Tax=Microcoleus sp. FACHB-672 TaxID=2692825 RepID=UPI00168697B4|nr:peptidoglycan-binding protein [Microcoleus sp. FACHB-672]MBD2042078.1 peptidoglycan-binding protein [Microcoleus sp. FACHB-672]